MILGKGRLKMEIVLRRLRVAPVRPRPRFAEPQLPWRSLRKLESTAQTEPRFMGRSASC